MIEENVKMIPSMVAEGMTTKQIADKLGVNPKTISNWIKKMRVAGYEIHMRRGRRPIKL